MPAFTPPDILVLGAGGVLGEAWLQGVLAGLAQGSGWDPREAETFLGTSAGAIVAAWLAGGRSPRLPGDDGLSAVVLPDVGAAEAAAAGVPGVTGGEPLADEEQPDLADAGGTLGVLGGAARMAAGWAAGLGAPLAPVALAAGAPAGAAVRALLLARAPEGSDALAPLEAELGRWDLRFDGRLRVAAVDRARGRRVVFGEPGAPPAPVPAAVRASCSVPWMFSAVTVDGVEYVDGGAWSVTNLDAAPARRGTRVLCLAPTAGLPAPEALSVFSALRVAARTTTELEALVLRGRGAEVRIVTPGGAAGRAMAGNLMSTGPRREVHAAAFAQGLALAREAG